MFEIAAPHARSVAANAFQKTLANLRLEKNVTEIQFRDVWLENIAAEKGIIAPGWYDPPPTGTIVIADRAESAERISYSSLREPKFWPTKRVIDFTNDIFFAYCSPVSIVDNYIGDFDITLYFGKNDRILQHFRNCFEATREVLNLLNETTDSRTLFGKSTNIFRERKLINEVISLTDVTPCDLGHSLPSINWGESKELSAEDKNRLRDNRKFINNVSTWKLSNERWFTIEPQLRSAEDPTLPQVSFHIICSVRNHVTISEDVFDIYRKEMKF